MEEDLIRRYFKGELSDSERVEVELRQLEDTEFADLMINFKSTQDGIRLAKKDALKERLKEIESQKKPKGRFMRIAIAASIAIIFGVGGMILWNQFLSSPENLYTEYYEPYPNIYAPITRDGDSLSSLENAFAHYELGEYKKALKGFNAELEINDNQDVLFYKAITLIQLDKSDQAKNTLSSIQFEQSNYQAQILWYQSLLFIKDEQLEKAKSTLKKLDKLNSGYKTNKVKKLLEKI
ncbi:MAG: hypothetical protein P8P74_02540 [Crocinitomicaceae bacterium]|nr:hypothetical protein [Crocinitomicaceae bacterium]